MTEKGYFSLYLDIDKDLEGFKPREQVSWNTSCSQGKEIADLTLSKNEMTHSFSKLDQDIAELSKKIAGLDLTLDSIDQRLNDQSLEMNGIPVKIASFEKTKLQNNKDVGVMYFVELVNLQDLEKKIAEKEAKKATLSKSLDNIEWQLKEVAKKFEKLQKLKSNVSLTRKGSQVLSRQ